MKKHKLFTIDKYGIKRPYKKNINVWCDGVIVKRKLHIAKSGKPFIMERKRKGGVKKLFKFRKAKK